MGDLANCPQCGALFVKGAIQVCRDCYKKEEAAFRTVYDFLKQRKNRQANIPQIVEATGVEEEVIMKFVKEKRLRPSQFPNLSYPCEKCGASINDGIICEKCADEITSDLQKQEEIDALSQRNKEQEAKKARTYYKFR
ncbi:TIGR03826 family flagellar region protein [Aquibacillus sediminis]|uniref:TIGR03826 family flagellar region protein n=1 Tax=Aquibacillus sediminis TaxID=2574734 RepID=UPI0011083A3C|nr:TIGR03826 family flagellar region protein [Aquibacillus sediminis]